MAWTIHGWQIPLSPVETEDIQTEMPARCGGPTFCDVCHVNSVEWQRANGIDIKTNVDGRLLYARALVAGYVNSKLDPTDRGVQINIDQVYVVSFMKTLKNWKGTFSTTIPDGMYYELTYNGDAGEVYLDAYKKLDNVVIPDFSA